LKEGEGVPFEVITTPSVILTSPASSDDSVIVRMSTRARLRFSPYRHRFGELRLKLGQDTWPKEIRDKIEVVSHEQSSGGLPPTLKEFVVILDAGTVLAVGRPVRTTVHYGSPANREYRVTLRGTPVSFQIETIEP